MADDPQFEDRLREALHREATELPFRLDAVTVRERIGSRSRVPGWLLPIAVPIGAAVVVALAVLNAFPGESPGRSLEPGIGQSATAAAEPTIPPSTVSPSSPTPAPTLHPAERVEAAVASDDGRLFLVGGRGRAGSLESVVAFDGRIWTDLPPLPQSRLGASAAILADGRLLIAGGEGNGKQLDSTLLLAPDGDAWTDGPPMPHPQAFMGTAMVDGRVYLFGGAVAEHARDVLIFDPDTETWTLGTPMPLAASRIAAAGVDGAAYVFGGRTEPDGTDVASALRYDPVADAWDALADMPGTGRGLSATVAGRRVWIVGVLISDAATDDGSGPGRRGFDGRIAEAWVYDLDSNAWTEKTGTRVWPGDWHAAFLQANGRILVVGGWPMLIVSTLDTNAP